MAGIVASKVRKARSLKDQEKDNQELRHARQQKIADRIERNQIEKSKWSGVEMKGDTWVYVGLGLGAVGLVVTVVGLGEKGFQTIELKIVGPSIIALGFSVIVLRVLVCIIPKLNCLTKMTGKLLHVGDQVPILHQNAEISQKECNNEND